MMISRFSTFLATAVFCSTVGISSLAQAEDLNISDTPLFVAVSIDPNIMFILDDSGSMRFGFMPGELDQHFNLSGGDFCPSPGTWMGMSLCNFYSNNGRQWIASSHLNKIYYDPTQTYEPPLRPAGTHYPDSNFNSAKVNGYQEGGCSDASVHCADLRSNYRAVMDDYFYKNRFGRGFSVSHNANAEPAFYFQNIGTAGCENSREATCYQKIDVSEEGAEQRQNFANWFSYYRTRMMVAKVGVSSAFHQQSTRMRVGYGLINDQNNYQGVRSFSGDERLEYFDWLSTQTGTINGSTPLRTALDEAGEYYEEDDPWRDDPEDSNSRMLSCRQSYSILMTDGYWSGSSADVGDTDGDSISNTLADVAYEYWSRDLKDGIPDNVPTSDINPADWQHMVTFGVGLGVEGTLDPDEAFTREPGDSSYWTDPDDSDTHKIDDLLHAAVNSKGGFFSAADPQTFAQQLAAVLADITARANSSTGVAVAATRLTTDSLVYSAEFDSEGWTGELSALNAEDGTVEHSAEDQLQVLGAENRNILTYDPISDSGVSFEPSENLVNRVMADAPGSFVASELFDYLRGDLSAGTGTMRARTSMLSDIVNSRPVFSGPGNEGWARIDLGYLDYIDNEKSDPRDPCYPAEDPCPGSRRNTVFVGSNGGMLHAFDARTLEEHFAYVPAAVHGNLWELADPGYGHKFYVDGQVAVADAQRNGNWATIVVGSLGAGGRGIYALDVTQPQNFGEGDVLWEFTAEDDPDLGYTYGEPLITRLEDGTWVAVFGNGYNSEENQAYLYVVDLINGPDADGNVLHKLPLGDSGNNGLSGVAGWRDVATRTYIDRVYAGDLNGTVWRVDFDSSEPEVVFEDGLFTDPDNRPITSTPAIVANPTGGLSVFVGTGKLIEGDDRLSTNLDRFFSIRDRNSSIGDTSDMSESTIAAVAGEPQFREIANPGDGTDGWFVDLALGSPSGERVMAKALVQFGVLIVATYEPVEDPCTPGGIQRLYVLDALTGNGALPFCQNCGGISVGIGAPISPPIVIKQHQRSVADGTIDFPGIINPDEPEDPATPPDAGGDPLREDWCSVYGIPPVVEGAAFQQLGTICEGRQVWLQRR